MGSKRMSRKGRRKKEKFLMLPRNVTDHPDFISLSSRAVKLLVDVAVQYNGHNNGDLCASMTLMKMRGWTSNDQRNKALKELIEKGLLVQSRQGGRKRASLQAITWRAIDYCRGKHDINPTDKPWRIFSKK